MYTLPFITGMSMYAFLLGGEMRGNMCRGGSQAKIMVMSKTLTLSVQFKLLRSKEGHLIS